MHARVLSAQVLSVGCSVRNEERKGKRQRKSRHSTCASAVYRKQAKRLDADQCGIPSTNVQAARRSAAQHLRQVASLQHQAQRVQRGQLRPWLFQQRFGDWLDHLHRQFAALIGLVTGWINRLHGDDTYGGTRVQAQHSDTACAGGLVEPLDGAGHCAVAGSAAAPVAPNSRAPRAGCPGCKWRAQSHGGPPGTQCCGSVDQCWVGQGCACRQGGRAACTRSSAGVQTNRCCRTCHVR